MINENPGIDQSSMEKGAFEPIGPSKLETKIRNIFFPENTDQRNIPRSVAKIIFPRIIETDQEMETRVKKEIAKKIKKEEEKREKENQSDKFVGDKLEIPDKKVRSKSKKGNVLWRLSEKIINDVVDDFSTAFPQFAEEFSSQPIDYQVTANMPISDQDLENFENLLLEKDTLMGEAYPLYELLTQDLSEKAASAKKGIRGKIKLLSTKIYGLIGYKFDLPIKREWENIVLQLNSKIGEKATEKAVLEMYFGEKEKFLKFKKLCKENGIDFEQAIEKMSQESFFISKQHKGLLMDLTQLKSFAGGLNLPGKIYDRMAPLAVSAVIIESTLLLIMSGGSLISNLVFPIIPAAFSMIFAAVIGTTYHEITHVLGGNYRDYYQKIKSLQKK